MAKQFVSYLRVSTARQGESGLGLEAQREAVASYLRSTGGTLLAEFVEVESGAAKDRPGLVQSISLCRRAGATLVLARLDRLARNVAFVSSLMEAGTEFVAVDAPYANRLMLHILAAFAEHEREQISLRTRAALAAAKARGVRLGVHGATLAQGHKREALEFSVSVGPTIRRLQLRGVVTLSDLADGLNADGVPTREGGRWHPMSVSRVLRRLDHRQNEVDCRP